MTYLFCVAGAPQPQPRAKARRMGKFVRVYNPGTADAWKQLVVAEANRVKPPEPISRTVRVRLLFRLQRPKSHLNKAGLLKPSAPVYPTGRPDVDNLAKAVLDALNDCAFWGDDAQVVDLEVYKRYAISQLAEGCEITVESDL